MELLGNGTWYSLYQVSPGTFQRGTGLQDAGTWQIVEPCAGPPGFGLQLTFSNGAVGTSPQFWSTPRVMQYSTEDGRTLRLAYQP